MSAWSVVIALLRTTTPPPPPQKNFCITLWYHWNILTPSQHFGYFEWDFTHNLERGHHESCMFWLFWMRFHPLFRERAPWIVHVLSNLMIINNTCWEQDFNLQSQNLTCWYYFNYFKNDYNLSDYNSKSSFCSFIFFN